MNVLFLQPFLLLQHHIQACHLPKKVMATKSLEFGFTNEARKKPRILSSLRLLYEILDIFLIHALHNYNNGRTVYVLFLEFVIESHKFQ